VPKAAQLEIKLNKLESDVDALTTKIGEVAASAAAIPDILAELARRFVAPDMPSVDTGGSSPANSNSESPESTNRSMGGFFGFGAK